MFFTVDTVAPAHGLIDVFNEAVVRPARELFAVMTGGASKLRPSLAVAAARRGIDAFLREDAEPASAERLRALVMRSAISVRQAGEALERSVAEEALDALDGDDFTPDPRRHANGFNVEAAFAWLAGDRAFIAAIGRAAALLARGGELSPLHRLHVLAETWPVGMPADSALGYGVVTSALAADPANPTGALHELDMTLAPGDRLVLASPAIAVPLFVTNARPPSEIARGSVEALVGWMLARVRKESATIEDAQAAVVVITSTEG